MKKLIASVCLLLTFMFVLSACGGAKFDKTKNITVLVREEGSGTKSAFMELIDLKDKKNPGGSIEKTSTDGILAEVKSNAHAIAYDSLGFVTGDVKKLKVDGVEATVANVKSGDYKISRPLSVVYKEATLENEVNNAFFTFLQSSEAQKIIGDYGCVSIVDDATAYVKNDSLSGTINISGSTSFQPLMQDLRDAFVKLQPNITVNVAGGGSGTGREDAEKGVSEFGMVSSEFKQEQAPSCTHKIICKDGIAVIVNKENTLDNITLEQLKSIYDDEAGENAITKWEELIK